jgi:hypothetical protein
LTQIGTLLATRCLEHGSQAPLSRTLLVLKFADPQQSLLSALTSFHPLAATAGTGYFYQCSMASSTAASGLFDDPTGEPDAFRVWPRGEFMSKIGAIAMNTAALAVLVLNAGPASASGGGSAGTWPAAFPLPTNPGAVLSQSSTTAVVRSTDPGGVVQAKLDGLYIAKMGCTKRLGVNRPRDYLCYNPATRKSDEVLFTFAALDATATDPSHSQTNAFSITGWKGDARKNMVCLADEAQSIAVELTSDQHDSIAAAIGRSRLLTNAENDPRRRALK